MNLENLFEGLFDSSIEIIDPTDVDGFDWIHATLWEMDISDEARAVLEARYDDLTCSEALELCSKTLEEAAAAMFGTYGEDWVFDGTAEEVWEDLSEWQKQGLLEEGYVFAEYDEDLEREVHYNTCRW